MSTFNNVSTFKSKVEEIVLNADAGLGDVYLVSRDRRYFLAHRIVLVCEVQSNLVTQNSIGPERKSGLVVSELDSQSKGCGFKSCLIKILDGNGLKLMTGSIPAPKSGTFMEK